jgi:outer membrane protein OmpA-like peptidoglycan-associated protein
MRVLQSVLALGAMITLGGCATSQVSILPGEGSDAKSSVEVLDSKTGNSVAVADTPGSVVGANGKVTSVDPKTLDTRYAELFAALPPAPRVFVLYFQENSVELTAESNALVPEIFAEMSKRPGADIEITGHTDTVGSAEVNDSFSLRRAAEVTSIFFAQGLDKAVIRIAGRGERDLREKTPDDTPSATNRRVELLVR